MAISSKSCLYPSVLRAHSHIQPLLGRSSKYWKLSLWRTTCCSDKSIIGNRYNRLRSAASLCAWTSESVGFTGYQHSLPCGPSRIREPLAITQHTLLRAVFRSLKFLLLRMGSAAVWQGLSRRTAVLCCLNHQYKNPRHKHACKHGHKIGKHDQ